MSELTASRPAVTVATVVERDGLFLLVEEETRAGTRAESACRARRGGGIAAGRQQRAKRSRKPAGASTRPRWSASIAGRRRTPARRSSAFPSPATRRSIDAARALDAGIVRALWLPYEEIVARRDEHRSPLVLRCIDDYRAGKRWPLNFVRKWHDAPAARRRRHVGWRGLVRRGVAAEAAGARRRRRLHEELGRRRHRRILHVARGPGRRGVGRRRARNRTRGGELRGGIPGARVRAFPARVRGRDARPIPTCCATARSSSAPSSTTRCASAPTPSPPATTRACARALGEPARVELLKAGDATKDQSYFLHRLTQEQLAPVMFPLGDMHKRDVRRIAREQGIPTWAKKDSTGICFIGERPFRDFLARYLPRTPGPVETPEGDVIGRHDGLAYYTLGQRQGLGIGGTRGRHGRAVVRRGEGPRAQRAGGRAGPRPSAAVPARAWTPSRCTGSAATAPALPARSGRQDALPDARRDVHAGGRRAMDGARRSTCRNGRRRPVSTWCCTTATCAWAAA